MTMVVELVGLSIFIGILLYNLDCINGRCVIWSVDICATVVPYELYMSTVRCSELYELLLHMFEQEFRYCISAHEFGNDIMFLARFFDPLKCLT